MKRSESSRVGANNSFKPSPLRGLGKGARIVPLPQPAQRAGLTQALGITAQRYLSLPQDRGVMQNFWNVVAIIAGLAGIVFFASVTIFILPYLAVISLIGFGLFLAFSLLTNLLKSPGEKEEE